MTVAVFWNVRLTAHMLAFLAVVSIGCITSTLYVDLPDLPVGVGVRPDSLLLSSLQAFDGLGPRDLKIGPCRDHQVVVPSGPNNVRIRAIGLLERVREACCTGEGGKRKHAGAECLKELHVAN